MSVEHATLLGRRFLASSYMSAGDAAPRRGDGMSPIDLRTRVEAVAATGWAGMGLVHGDVVRARDSIGLSGLASLLADHGITELELEFLRDWWTTGERRIAADRVRRDLFDAAGPLGVKTIKCGAVNHGEPIDRDHFLAEFDRLATDAREAGTRVALETMRSSDVLPTIADGADVVRSVGNPNGGLAVDCYHVTRGGTPYSELASILPPGLVFIVELSDGNEHVDGTDFEGEVNERRFVGEGVFHVPEFIVAVHDHGYEGLWGVEILSEEYRALPVQAALERAYAGAVHAIATAEEMLADRAGARRGPAG